MYAELKRRPLAALLAIAVVFPLQALADQAIAASAAPAASAAASADSARSAAFDAAVWAMPVVSVDTMREAYFRDAGASYNDIVYWSRPADWKNQTATPNSTSLYVYFNYNLKDGPVVVDIPAEADTGVFGSMLDVWQVPLVDVGHNGADHGQGGRYLLLPPDFKGVLPTDYIPVQSTTNNGYALIRVTPKSLSSADLDKANAWIRELRVAPLTEQSGDAIHQRFVKMDGRVFDGIVRFDDTYFERLARIVSEEPAAPRDADMYVRLRDLGIEPGKPFAPDAATRAWLRAAAQAANERFRQTLLSSQQPWWPGSQWGTSAAVRLGVKTHFSFDEGQRIDTGMRGAAYFLGYAPPQRLGKATFYLTSWRDGRGQLLNGSDTYSLHVPPEVPAREFWAVNVYDSATCAFLRNATHVGVDSHSKLLRRNADGSVDLYFGPHSPSDKAANWIYTAPGKTWFAAFRLYGPEPAIFDKSWTLPPIVQQ